MQCSCSVRKCFLAPPSCIIPEHWLPSQSPSISQWLSAAPAGALPLEEETDQENPGSIDPSRGQVILEDRSHEPSTSHDSRDGPLRATGAQSGPRVPSGQGALSSSRYQAVSAHPALPHSGYPPPRAL